MYCIFLTNGAFLGKTFITRVNRGNDMECIVEHAADVAQRPRKFSINTTFTTPLFINVAVTAKERPSKIFIQILF